MHDLGEMVAAVREVFPEATCVGHSPAKGFCIYWPIEGEPVIATGQHPHTAWRAAFKLIKGKKKGGLEKLKKSLQPTRHKLPPTGKES